MALQALKKRESFSDKAYHMLREAILTGELKPGEQLTEEALSAQLGISRTPILSALQLLTAMRLTECDARGRIIVSDVIDSEVRDVDLVRLRIEPLSAQLAAERGLTEVQIKELRGYCHTQTRAAAEEDLTTFFDYGYRFHNRLAEFTGNHFLAEMIGRASMTAVRYLMNSETPSVFIDNSGEEHERILEYIIARDAAGAAAEMEHHIRSAEPSFLE